MPTQKLTQNSFVNGQYDRTAQNQESVQGGLVSTGLSYARNIVSGDKMEARKRLGTKKRILLDGYAVIAPYRYGEDDMALVFTDKKLTVYDLTGNDIKSFVGADNLRKFEQEWTSNSTNGYKISASSGSSDVYKIFSSNYVGETIGATNNGYYIVFEAPDKTSVHKFNFKFITYLNNRTNGDYRGFQSASLFCSDDGSTWKPVESEILKPDNGKGISKTYYEETTETSIGPDLLTRLWTIEFSINAKEVISHKFWKVVFWDYYNGVNNSNLRYGVESQIWIQDISTSESINTDLLVSDLKNIKYDQYAENFKFVSSNTSVYSFSIKNGNVALQKFEPKVTGEERKIFEIYGQPSCVGYFQNRLWFSGFKNNPALVLGSKFGDENVFSASTTLAFDDYFNLTCNQLKSHIKNIVGAQNVLYCFSQDGISFIDSGSNAIIASNQSIEFHLKNRMPASSATPTFKDDVLLYASADGTKLYAVDYDLIVERFQVEDLAKYAKDVTKGKIKELHYLNNKSQLLYGLCEDDSMFALMYRKGKYNGFFPIDIQNGFVYDICPIKLGQDYKLFMVTNRSGRWYLEEKLDEGVYVDTSSVLLSSEEKKWATYDNIENNIALDCYENYENSVYGSINIVDNTVETNIDLENYIGQTVMFAEENSKNFLLADIVKTNKTKLYAWKKSAANGEPVAEFADREYIYTLEPAFPGSYKPYYSADAKPIGTVIEGRVVGYESMKNYDDVLTIGTSLSAITSGYSSVTYTREEISDIEVQTSAEIHKVASRGESNFYNKVLYPFDSFETDLPAGTEIGVVSQGRYLGEFIVPDDGVVQLPFVVQKITYGATYLARGIIKIQQPYESMKQVQQVAVSVLNTGHLEIGTSLGDMLELEKIKDDSHLDLTTITMNGSYVLVPSDTPEWEKNIIFQSKKGLPFTVNCIEAIVNYSNMGGK